MLPVKHFVLTLQLSLNGMYLDTKVSGTPFSSCVPDWSKYARARDACSPYVSSSTNSTPNDGGNGFFAQAQMTVFGLLLYLI